MTEEQERFMEENVFPIISLAGESKSLAYEALRLAKECKFTESDEKMRDADSLLLEAHNFQSNLISKEACGEQILITMLFVHAQDHLMTAISEKNLIKEMIDILKRK